MRAINTCIQQRRKIIGFAIGQEVELDSWLNWDTFLDLILGLSLSAASGFRVFIPLLTLSAAAVVGHVDLPSDFDWIETNQALIIFAIASAIEIVGYYIPWLDGVLELVAIPAAIVSGTLITASTTPEFNPVIRWTLAVVAGGGAAGLTKGMTTISRLISTFLTAGLANPVIATIELFLAIGIAVLALTLPLVAGTLVLGILLVATRRITKFIKAQSSNSDSHPPSDAIPQ